MMKTKVYRRRTSCFTRCVSLLMTCVLLIGFVPPDSIQAAEKKWTSVLPEKLRSVLMLEDENVRILETDDLYTVTAENSDGTLSVNTFSMPIRYEKDGQYGYRTGLYQNHANVFQYPHNETSDWYLEPITIGVTMIGSADVTLNLVESRKLNACVTPEIAPQDLIWTSSSPASVAVQGDGTITGVGVGGATITACSVIDGSQYVTWSVSVTPPPHIYPSSITINGKPTNNTMAVDQKHSLTASVLPSNSAYRDVQWSSSNPSVATVSSGTITALSPGVTTITAKIIGPQSYTDSFELTVKRSEDPFHPTNIEYMQIKKYNEDQSCIYRESETTTIVLKSALLNYEYFECYTSSRDSAVFRVDNNLKNELYQANEVFEAAPAMQNPYYCVGLAKSRVDTMVNKGILEPESAEYYGLWATVSNLLYVQFDMAEQQIQLAGAVITAAYSTYCIVSSICAMQAAVSEWNNTVYRAMAENIDDLCSELSRDGTKYTKENIMWIVRRPNGQISWLETGSESAGFQHILKQHPLSQFKSLGITTESQLSKLIYESVSTKNPVGTYKAGGFVYAMENDRFFNIVIGSNGFLVDAYDITDKIKDIQFY